jgi:hypothetical protein
MSRSGGCLHLFLVVMKTAQGPCIRVSMVLPTGFMHTVTRSRPLSSDTPAVVEQVLVEGYRRMSPGERLQRVVALNCALELLAPCNAAGR